MKRRGVVLCGLLAVLVVVFLVSHSTFQHAVSNTQFEIDTRAHKQQMLPWEKNNVTTIAGADDTIRYLHDDFSGYGQNSMLLDGFESVAGYQVKNTSVKLGPTSYEGQYGLEFSTKGDSQKDIIIKKTFTKPLNLQRWQEGGYLTAWVNLSDRMGVKGVALRLGSDKGTRTFSVLPNLQTNYPNVYNQDDPFVNLDYPESISSASWTDYSLAKGWNYLPWRVGPDYFTDQGSFDSSHVAWYEIELYTAANPTPVSVTIDDLRIQDGLQKVNTVTNGNWYPPLGLPQYGVYDVQKDKSGRSYLRIQNVRQTQYPSNGDHGRLLSKMGTPKNFAMKARFTLQNVGDGGDLNNSWFRIFYDFDPSYDPGHDWFGTYFSLDYKQAGLLTVIPVERFVRQTQEPLESVKSTAFRQKFMPTPGQEYEYDITVKGQQANVTVYKVDGNKLYKQIGLAYTFARARNDKGYPLGFEITGNTKVNLYDVEVLAL